ncbi:hypothetical protein ACHAWX_004586 [Stephanocyclus meneghinianus]
MVIHPLAIKIHTGHGSFVLDRVPRMKEQPITDLINALQQLGTKVSCVEETGFPPMTIHIERLDFLSLLLMASPLCKDDVTNISAPYV